MLFTSRATTPDLSNSTRPSPVQSRIQTPVEDVAGLGSGAAATTPRFPECWGHRGQAKGHPENTTASFIRACEVGVDGIETDLHVTTDNLICCFHDAKLDDLTNGKGRITSHAWYGDLEHVRTKESPHLPVPLFTEILEILLRPGNERVKLNLDCKANNDADQLFGLIKEVMMGYEGWQERPAPRIMLGLWHISPQFLIPAATHLPNFPRYALSSSMVDCRRYFWGSVHGFSMYHEALNTPDGQRFLSECRKAGTPVCSWTLKRKERLGERIEKERMRQCARWGLQAYITDHPEMFRKVEEEFKNDFERAIKPTLETYLLPWVTKPLGYGVAKTEKEDRAELEDEAGKFEDWEGVKEGLQIVRAE